MTHSEPDQRFLLCVKNEGYPASLELPKAYRALPDPVAGSRGFVRIVDESGEDCLYPAEWFVAGITKSAYVDVTSRSRELGLNAVFGLAILPRNFADAKTSNDLIHESSTITIRQLWRQAGIEETRLEPEGVRLPTISFKSADWIGPVIFIGASYYLQNENCINVALSVIANYLTELFKGIPGERRAKLSIVVEQTKSKKTLRVDYEGPLEDFKHLPDVIKGLADE